MTSDIRKRPTRRSSELSFIEEWCKHYGLTSDMTSYLRHHGYTTGDDLLTLYVDDINRLPELDYRKKCLLRGAILQYRQSRSSVDKELQKKGVILEKKPKHEAKKRNVQSMWRHHAGNIQKMDAVVMSMLSPEQREAIRQLRRRLHNKRTASDGKTLYQRILERRQTVLNVCFSSNSGDNNATNSPDNSDHDHKPDDQDYSISKDDRKSASGRQQDVLDQRKPTTVYRRTASESQLTNVITSNRETSASKQLNSKTAIYHETSSKDRCHLVKPPQNDNRTSNDLQQLNDAVLGKEEQPTAADDEVPSGTTQEESSEDNGREENVNTGNNTTVAEVIAKDTDVNTDYTDTSVSSAEQSNLSNVSVKCVPIDSELELAKQDELSEKLDGMLQALLVIGLVDPTTDEADESEVNLEESQKKTDEVLWRLERELFTEEEKMFLVKLKQLQEKYNNTESAEYEQELIDLIGNI